MATRAIFLAALAALLVGMVHAEDGDIPNLTGDFLIRGEGDEGRSRFDAVFVGEITEMGTETSLPVDGDYSGPRYRGFKIKVRQVLMGSVGAQVSVTLILDVLDGEALPTLGRSYIFLVWKTYGPNPPDPFAGKWMAATPYNIARVKTLLAQLSEILIKIKADSERPTRPVHYSEINNTTPSETAVSAELATQSHGEYPIPQQSKDKDLYLVADSIILIKRIAQNNIPSECCLARITPRKGIFNSDTVGDITIIKSLSSGESGIDATYGGRITGWFQYDHPTRWLPFRYSTNPNPATVLLLGPASMFHGHLPYGAPMMYIYTPWLELLPSLYVSQVDQADDLSAILKKPMLSDLDLLRMLTILKKDPSLFTGPDRDRILSLEAKTHGYPRAILVGTLIDVLVNDKYGLPFTTKVDKDQLGLLMQVIGSSNSLSDSDLYMIAVGLKSSETMRLAEGDAPAALLSPILRAAQKSPANYPVTLRLLTGK